MEPISRIKADYDEILSGYKDDPLKVSTIKGLASKVFILATASYLETEIVGVVCNQLNVRNNEKCPAFNFSKRKGVNRQYHTWFDWKKSNIVDFLALFGDEFKVYGRKLIDLNAEMKETEIAFMHVGSKRNLLIHNNFVSFSIDLDYDESFALCRKSLGFIELTETLFKNYTFA